MVSPYSVRCGGRRYLWPHFFPKPSSSLRHSRCWETSATESDVEKRSGYPGFSPFRIDALGDFRFCIGTARWLLLLHHNRRAIPRFRIGIGPPLSTRSTTVMTTTTQSQLFGRLRAQGLHGLRNRATRSHRIGCSDQPSRWLSLGQGDYRKTAFRVADDR